MSLLTLRGATHALVVVLFYVSVAFDFVWWTLIQRGEVAVAEYDYIVVGGGSGGSVAAGRLSENGTFSVLLLEAGPAPTPLHRFVPLGPLQFNSAYDWGYQTEPQEHGCRGLQQRRSFWPMGRLLGGSSQLNFMMYVRGQRRDYDRWAEENPGWSYEEVVPYFERSISYHGDKSHLGSAGPWQIALGAGVTETDHQFIASGRQLGYEPIDYNSLSGPGLYYTDSNRAGIWRHALSDAFLHDRSNLHVVTNALVEKVELERDPLRAVGVTFTKFGERLTVRARWEVILSAGAVNTPTVLMRSGVGPADHLRELGIPVLLDAPVGESLNAHVGAPLIYLTNRPTSPLPQPSNILASLWELFANGTGHMASNVCSSGLFMTSSLSESPDYPDIQIFHCLIHPWIMGAGSQPDFNLSPDLFDEMLAEMNETTHGVSLLAQVLRPRSRGTVRLSSADPTSPPRIQPNFLERREDMEVLLEGMRTMARLASMPPYSELLLRPVVIPACRPFSGDQQLECLARHFTWHVYHPTSTCRMAPRHVGGVVDHRLRVHGVQRLRVVDASVMPFVTSGNTNAPTVMIAEKGADMILQDL
ncbi:L-sorbose 1-dehydrogenase-like isoform X1 [Amphibalanus amphitrite]|uniref:L-sorbose 1-dehydrogenase-like isoform X1 n=1 Tax=Amphibalanus amphitrite TaxID=1232801 RepID=UPI001C9156F0|nr:L-sorbose 1-dehydrogenase-like isoform X1 [Amphibalanus amphitrite]